MDMPIDNRDGDLEVINGVTFTHRFARASGLNWHYAEAGSTSAEPIVFLHGAPESWYSWHYQMEGLASQYRPIALDMKGYGQTDKPDESYAVTFIAQQVSELLATIGLKKYNLVSHDWGTMVADPLASLDRSKILRYLRMEGWVLVQDKKNVPHVARWKQDQSEPIALMGNAGQFVRMIYKNTTVKPVPEHDLLRIISEFSRSGVALAVPRYFRDLDLGIGSGEGLQRREEMFARMTFPVLLLQAENDPLQPQSIFKDAENAFPNAVLRWVTGSGHFTELEQPDQVTRAMRDFIVHTPL